MDNFAALHDALGLDLPQARQLIANSFEASFLDDRVKQVHLSQLSLP